MCCCLILIMQKDIARKASKFRVELEHQDGWRQRLSAIKAFTIRLRPIYGASVLYWRAKSGLE